ncbi:hypothetical protein NPIL_26371 [Nephila pilipes]|uniref:Uncharacterized protein n=1 Tax=Nephila pilipes TaxID=299642 RepID=A0A8X6I8I3_NEPPI|nr:hypothetical protein NPIL_26371 [Nephila pilipes]
MTLVSPDVRAKNQTDHIAIRVYFKRSVCDIKLQREADVEIFRLGADADLLLMSILKLKLARSTHKRKQSISHPQALGLVYERYTQHSCLLFFWRNIIFFIFVGTGHLLLVEQIFNRL